MKAELEIVGVNMRDVITTSNDCTMDGLMSGGCEEYDP